MFYIKLDKNMQLIITAREPIYRGENLNHRIIYLIPAQVEDIEVMSAFVYLNYVRADGVADVVALERMDERYNETYLQYTFPITCKLTKYPGEVCTWLHIYTGNPSNPITAKSGECILHVEASKSMDAYLTDRYTTALYQIHKEMSDSFTQVNGAIDAVMAEKADNITFNSEDSTIQLISNGEPIGDRITVSPCSGLCIDDMKISVDGELLVFFDDGSIKNLGKVVGEDGVVYVPHIDAHKILTFTIESAAGEIPDPVDLNPYDEWNNIEEGQDSDYVWEEV